jgi:glycosyltransferase involved in cell wall biosynthesis
LIASAPTASVIIPVFNGGTYIAQAISSALATCDVPIEVIVIDDQSTDDTWQVLEGFGDAIQKVSQSKGGPYKARNLGARLARGEWLAFLDADDEWIPGKLAKQLAIADNETALIYTDRYNFGDCNRVKARQSDCVKLWEGDVFEPLLLNNFITLSSVLMRKSWFERLGGFSEQNLGVQDWDLWLRCASEGGIVKLLPEPLTRYRIHSEQMSRNLDDRAAERLAVVQRSLRSSRGQKVRKKIARQALANIWEIGASQAALAHPGKAILWYMRAAYHWPWKWRMYKGIVKCCVGRV